MPDRVQAVGAGLLRAPASFPTVAAALVAVRCWLDDAAARGHRPPELCALLNVADTATTATLGTRAFVAAMVWQESTRGLTHPWPVQLLPRC